LFRQRLGHLETDEIMVLLRGITIFRNLDGVEPEFCFQVSRLALAYRTDLPYFARSFGYSMEAISAVCVGGIDYIASVVAFGSSDPPSLAAQNSEHWRMPGFNNSAIAEKHVYTTRQARIKAAHHPHYVNAFESLRTIFFKKWRVLNCIFVWPRNTKRIPAAGVPACWRIWMIIGDFAIADHKVMR
jgi:hypothetical protein